MTLIVLLPLLTSVVVRTVAWIVILGRQGLVNSVLQSLVHTPPLAELLLSPGGARLLPNGSVNGFQPIALTRELVARSLQHASRGPLAPVQFAKSLRRISRRYTVPVHPPVAAVVSRLVHLAAHALHCTSLPACLPVCLPILPMAVDDNESGELQCPSFWVQQP